MNKVYYQEMLKRERLVPFFSKNKMVFLITFYITNDETKYINSDPWQALDDDPEGSICYIAQMLTSKDPENPRLSYQAWHNLKAYIKDRFPNVRSICWRRWDKNTETVKTYKKEMEKWQQR